MDIPVYVQFVFPLLKLFADEKKHNRTQMLTFCVHWFGFSDEQQEKRLPSGKSIIYSRMGAAKTYLEKLQCLEKTAYGEYQITPLGLKVFQKYQNRPIHSYKDLLTIPEFKNTAESQNSSVSSKNQTDYNDLSPEEQIDSVFHRFHEQLYADLIDQCQKMDCYAFERLVLDLLLNLGYGGPQAKAVVTLKAHDGGIDGIINEDKLGLDVIYIQAKRWATHHSVGRPEIQKFIGALSGKAQKGVFITTSFFTKEAKSCAAHQNIKIILIDAQELVRLMVESNTGVLSRQNYTLKTIDANYFDNYDEK